MLFRSSSTVQVSNLHLQFAFLFPIENFVWTFSSPEAVFKYAGTGEIADVIDGKHSCMIIYSNGRNSYSTMIAHKDANGYKLSSALDYRVTSSINEKGVSAITYRLSQTTDNYVTVLWFSNESNSTIKDNKSSTFFSISSDISNGESPNTIFSYAFVENLNDEYALSLNNSEFFKLN